MCLTLVGVLGEVAWRDHVAVLAVLVVGIGGKKVLGLGRCLGMGKPCHICYKILWPH